MFHHRFLHLFHFRPLHYGATKKLGANQTFFIDSPPVLGGGSDNVSG